MKDLKEETLKEVRDRLSDVSSSLNGLGGLFTLGRTDLFLKDDEFWGVGELIKGLGAEVSRIEDILKCGNEGGRIVEGLDDSN